MLVYIGTYFYCDSVDFNHVKPEMIPHLRFKAERKGTYNAR